MANIKTLSISIRADISDFTKGLTKARRDLNKWAKDIPGATAGVGSTFAAMGAAAAASMTYFTAQAMASIDSVAKLSDRLGVTTEFFTGLQHAADLSGVSTEELTGALEKFVKQLPTGADIGASFLKVAEDITAIQDPTARAQAAMEAFGKSGQRLLPLLTTNIRELQEEAEALGLTYSRADAAMVEAANDSMTRVKALFTGAFQQIAIGVAPFIEAISKKIIGVGMDGLKSGETISKGFELAAKAIGFMADAISAIEAFWHGFKVSVNAVIASFARLIEMLLKMQEFGSFGAIDTSEWRTWLNQFADLAEGDALRSIKDMDKAWADFENGTGSNKVMQQFQDIRMEAQRAAKELQNAADANKGIGGAFGLEAMKKGKGVDFMGNGNWLDAMAEKFNTLDDAMRKLSDTGMEAAARWQDLIKTDVEKMMEKVLEVVSLEAIGKLTTEQADKALALIGKELEGLLPKDEVRNAGLGRQIDLRNMALTASGIARDQVVSDPKNAKQNEQIIGVLKEIEMKIGKPLTAV